MDLSPVTSSNLVSYNQSQATIDRARADLAKTRLHSDKISDADMEKIDAVAKKYESVFVSQMMSHMMKDVGKNSMFYGGQTEEIFKGLLIEEYGKTVADQGGIGLADHIKAELIRIQEAQQ